MLILVSVIGYIFCGFATTGLFDPDPSMHRSDRIKTFCRIILLWPYYFIRPLKEIFSWMWKRWIILLWPYYCIRPLKELFSWMWKRWF